MFLSAVSPGFCVVLDHRGRLGVGDLGGKVGSVVRNLRAMRVVYMVNVSESCGSGLSRIKGR